MNRDKIIILGLSLILMVSVRPIYGQIQNQVNGTKENRSESMGEVSQSAANLFYEESMSVETREIIKQKLSKIKEAITYGTINEAEVVVDGLLEEFPTNVKALGFKEHIERLRHLENIEDPDITNINEIKENVEMIEKQIIPNTEITQFRIEEEMARIEELKAGSELPYNDKDLITLNFIDVDVREILSSISLQQEVSIVPAQGVSGAISVHLYQVPLDKAMEYVSLAAGCVYQKRGEMYYVYRPEEPIDPQAERLEMKMFKIKYAEIENIQEILESLPGIRSINIHRQSKIIMVEDTPENIAKIESVLQYWDTEPRQVVIEASILEIDLTDDMAMGVNWEKIVGDARIGTGGFSSASVDIDGEISPINPSGAGFFGNIITGAGNFSAALDTLQSMTKINTLSAPKILAIHGKRAEVQVGGEQGYRVTTVNEGISTENIEFIQTGTILDITPYINDNGTVLLEVKPSIRSAVLELGIPVVKTTEVTTWLMANNGATVFIGGLIQDTKIVSTSKVPLLGDIPIIRGLFSRNSHDYGKSELVILITPRIVGTEPGDIEQMESIEGVREIDKDFENEPLPGYEKFFKFLSPHKMNNL